MSDVQSHHLADLVTWLKANVYATITLVLVVVGALIGAGRYLANSENQITQNQVDVKAAASDIKLHQAAIESLDRRINEAVAASRAADAEMKGKIDVLDERSKFAVERATQPNLPIPTGARR